MRFIRGTAGFIGLCAVAGAAHAGVTTTWTAVSDYDFRGISQSNQEPALQASVDYAHDSGWYIGAWASNIDFGVDESTGVDDPKIETDFYTGFTKTLESGFSYDVGGVFYGYPQESLFNYYELYGGVGVTAKNGISLKGKLFYSPDFGGDATDGNTPAEYLQADMGIPLPKDFSLSLHVGYSFGDYWDGGFLDNSQYFDYAVGVAKTVGKFSVNVKYINGSDLADIPGSNLFSTDDKVVLSVATTFPWGE